MPRTKVYRDAMTQSDQNLKDITKKALYSGAIGAAAGYFLFNETGNTEFFNMNLPSSVAVGGGVGLGSVASDLLSGFVINKLDQDQEIKTAESTAIKLGVAGLGSAVALKWGSGVDFSIETVGVGAASKFAGDAVYYEMDPLGALFN